MISRTILISTSLTLTPPVTPITTRKTKALAEQEVIKANGSGGPTTTSLRPHAIWGPRDKFGFVPSFVSRLVDGRFRSIGRDREVLVDLCNVRNAAHSCRLAGRSEKAGGKIYFITDGESVNIWPFIDHVCDVLEMPKPAWDVSPASAMRIASCGIHMEAAVARKER